jgi:hypothetical protein
MDDFPKCKCINGGANFSLTFCTAGCMAQIYDNSFYGAMQSRESVSNYVAFFTYFPRSLEGTQGYGM